MFRSQTRSPCFFQQMHENAEKGTTSHVGTLAKGGFLGRLDDLNQVKHAGKRNATVVRG